MSTKNKKDNSSGSTFHLENNTIRNAAFGDNSMVNIHSIDSDRLDLFNQKLTELHSNVMKSSSILPKEDISKVEKEISVIESELNKTEAITPKVIFNALQSISKILGSATGAGVILKQLYDILMTFFGGS